MYYSARLSHYSNNHFCAFIVEDRRLTNGKTRFKNLFPVPKPRPTTQIFVAICAIFILPDFPPTTIWLTPLERKLAQLRMAEDVGEENEADIKEGHNQWTGFTTAVTDWKVWWLAFTWLSQVLSLSFNAYFPSESSL